MLIYIIRHGETEYNKEKRYQGQTDIPLSAEGRLKIRSANFRPETVYTSTLTRAVESARLIFPGSNYIQVDDLKEMNFGKFEGKNHIEMENDPDYRAWVDSNCETPCPGGESREEFSERIFNCIKELVKKTLDNGNHTLVIVAHGGTMMAAMEKIALPRKAYHDWLTGNAEGYLLEYTEGTDITECKVREKLYFHEKGAELGYTVMV